MLRNCTAGVAPLRCWRPLRGRCGIALGTAMPQRPTARTRGSRPPDDVGSSQITPGEAGETKKGPLRGTLFRFTGAPGEIRTPDLLVRSQTLYPTELRARCTGNSTGGERGIRTLEGLLTLTPLAGARLRPLGHLSGLQRAAKDSGPAAPRKAPPPGIAAKDLDRVAGTDRPGSAGHGNEPWPSPPCAGRPSLSCSSRLMRS